MAFINIVTGHTGVDHVTSDDDRHFNAAVVGNGDFILEGGNGWEPTIIGANSVRVASGEASVQGCHIRSSEPVEITLEVGVSGYKRNDLIGILYKNTNGIESAELTFVRGVATTGTPVDPTYTADDILNGGEERFAPLIRAVFNGTAIESVNVIAKKFGTVSDTIRTTEDMNNLVETGFYFTVASAHAPFAGASGYLIVNNSKNTDSISCSQQFTEWDTGIRWTRECVSGVWNTWRRVTAIQMSAYGTTASVPNNAPYVSLAVPAGTYWVHMYSNNLAWFGWNNSAILDANNVAYTRLADGSGATKILTFTADAVLQLFNLSGSARTGNGSAFLGVTKLY